MMLFPSNCKIVAVFYSAQEAELARMHLDGAGIDAIVDGQHVTSMLPLHSIAFGGVHVLVAEQDAQAARELLATMKSSATTNDPTNGETKGSDPASATQAGDAWMRRAAMSALLGIIVIPVVPSAYALYLLVRYGSLPRSRRGGLHRLIAIVGCAAFLGFAVLLWRQDAWGDFTTAGVMCSG
jgi:hypothetical protein